MTWLASPPLPPVQSEIAERTLRAALRAVDPAEAVRRALRLEGDRLWAGGDSFELDPRGSVRLLGLGKAAWPMTTAAAEIFGARAGGGVLVTKEGHLPPGARLPGVTLLESGHPVPDERSLAAGEALLRAAAAAGPHDTLVALLSGGGSALACAPVEGVSLAELQALTGELLACGAAIGEINALRRRLDRVKGGGLARACGAGQILVLALSDVTGDALESIASGPFTPDPAPPGEARRILERTGLAGRVPAALRAHLEREIPAPGPEFSRVRHVLVGSNVLAARAALDQARADGLAPLLLTACLQGEARQAGRFLACIARQAAASGDPPPRPCCIVAGGETTVTLRGSGLGGRNQELALGAVEEMSGLEQALLVALATDGGDGPTDAAGAWVNGETLQRARSLNLEPARFLAQNDAYRFFDPLDGLIRTGPTRTNVCDLALIFLF